MMLLVWNGSWAEYDESSMVLVWNMNEGWL